MKDIYILNFNSSLLFFLYVCLYIYKICINKVLQNVCGVCVNPEPAVTFVFHYSSLHSTIALSLGSFRRSRTFVQTVCPFFFIFIYAYKNIVRSRHERSHEKNQKKNDGKKS